MAKRDRDGDFDGDGDIRQHQKMARGMGLDKGNFGIEPLAKTSAGVHPDRGLVRELPHKDRHIPIKHSKHIMPAQANPDHGPSHYSESSERDEGHY